MIENYTITEWFAFLIIYSFLGWCIESTIVSVSKRKLVNRGFLTGPFLPIYGFGALTILISTLLVKDNYVLVYLCGMTAATILEYVTGALMEAIFNMRYWDYSKKKFNINGYICLRSSLFWGVLSVLLVCFIHIPIASFLDELPPLGLKAVLAVAGVLVSVDAVHAFKKALDFQKLLTYETVLRKELSEVTQHIAELKDTFEELANEKQREYIAKQEQRLQHIVLELNAAKTKLIKFNMASLKSFPTATSEKFDDVLEEVKEYINMKKKSKKL